MLHMTDVEKSPSLSKNNVCYLWSFVAKYVFLQFTLFCREICFGTIYALLRGEKFSQKLGKVQFQLKSSVPTFVEVGRAQKWSSSNQSHPRIVSDISETS